MWSSLPRLRSGGLLVIWQLLFIVFVSVHSEENHSSCYLFKCTLCNVVYSAVIHSPVFMQFIHFICQRLTQEACYVLFSFFSSSLLLWKCSESCTVLDSMLFFVSSEPPWPPFSSWGGISYPVGTSLLQTWQHISKSVSCFQINQHIPSKWPNLNNFTMFCDQNCTVDPTQDVLKRLETLGEAFSQRFGQAVGPHCVGLGRQVLTRTEKMMSNNYSMVILTWWNSSVCDSRIFLMSLRDLPLASSFITKSWKQCWNRYVFKFMSLTFFCLETKGSFQIQSCPDLFNLVIIIDLTNLFTSTVPAYNNICCATLESNQKQLRQSNLNKYFFFFFVGREAAVCAELQVCVFCKSEHVKGH